MSRYRARIALTLALAALLAAIMLPFGARPALAKSNPARPALELIYTSVTGSADVLTSSITTTRPSAAWRMTVGIDSGASNSTLSVSLAPNSGVASTFLLNGGTALTAGNLYTFTFSSPDGWDVNLQFGTSTTATIVLEEIVDGDT